MPLYFHNHPTILYNILHDNSVVRATDITSRPKLSELAKNAALVFYEYLVKDGERADQIAYRYYGDEQLDWIIYLANEMHDPYFAWPLDSFAFDQYIRQRYGSVSAARNTFHHYEWIIQAQGTALGPLQERIILPEKVLWVDGTTYAGLSGPVRRNVDAYSYEETLNENRRHIHILDKIYIPTILRRLREVYPASEV